MEGRADLERRHPRFRGNWEDLQQFERLAGSAIRTEEREQALREWDQYKRSRQLAKRGKGGKGARIRALSSRVIDLTGAQLDGICVGYVDLRGAILDDCSVRSVWLKGAILDNASLKNADFSTRPELPRGPGRLLHASLRGADLSGANLSGVDLSDAVLNDAVLANAELSDANLSRATLVGTNVDGARLDGACVYGVAAWDLIGEPISQRDLVISDGEPAVTVDRLKVAQFLYLLLNNADIRDVLDTVSTKAVLILGRFSPERKPVLELLRGLMRRLGLVPILFDFVPSDRRDLTETIQILAGMARFILADISDVRAVAQELGQIVPLLPSVPVQPLLLRGQDAYVMFEHWRRFASVLPILEYQDVADLEKEVAPEILRRIEAHERGDTAAAERARLEARIRELEQRLASKSSHGS